MADGSDRVLVAPALQGEVELPVGEVFAEGARLREAYSGEAVQVQGGKVKLQAKGSVLLEARLPDQGKE